MSCRIDSDKFSANDLALFIESMEQISLMESLKFKQRQMKTRSHNLVDNLSYMDHHYTTPTCSNTPEEESILESFEEKYIGYNSTDVEYNEYYTIDYNNQQGDQEDSLSYDSTIYSMPYDCVASTKLEDCNYETLDFTAETLEDGEELHHYEEPSQVIKKTKTKRKLSLFGLVRKKYKKCFSSKSNNWPKSESWTKLTVF